MLRVVSLPTHLLPSWKHHRVVHSRFPPKNLFDDADAARQQLLAELEGVTSDRLLRWRESVSDDDFRAGNGWGPVMAAFCYVRAGRFNSAFFGAYYCASSVHTAIAEWSYHAGKVWADFQLTDQASAVVRCYTGHFKQPLVDLRADDKAHHLTSYAYSQAKAGLLKVEGEYGLLYRSVRHPLGECAALLRPPATSPVKQASHYVVQWDGAVFKAFAKMGGYEPL